MAMKDYERQKEKRSIETMIVTLTYIARIFIFHTIQVVNDTYSLVSFNNTLPEYT
jgi:hypothetical protein